MLGPSGSGKTTLLKSVVGQLQPTEGWVKVFGFQPNQPGSQIPGPAIGYMPQELAVYEDFTIKETLWYFGRLYRVPNKVIKERIEFLLNFLDLPRGKRLVTNMSGGQKRRVSLASALVHSPPLLILDEPTVGVDPLLRQSIWQHLVTLTQTEKITVIVTTHYIEEARRANVVGLMRRGKLLAENTPDDLMAKHDSKSLEDVFLKLCVTDTMRRAQKFATMNGLPVPTAICHGPNSVSPTPEIDCKQRHFIAAKPIGSLCGPTHDSGASNSLDEGINSSTNGSNVSTIEEAPKTQLQDSTVTNENHLSPASRSSAASVATTLEVADNTSPVGTQPATSPDNDDQIRGLSTVKPDSVESPGLESSTKQNSKRFHLKSLLKFGQSSDDDSRKVAERRRQSGSHYIEQLMNRYQEQQQQQQASIDKMLSCDVATKPPKRSRHQMNVPKIEIQHGDSYGDLRVSSNVSSERQSPIDGHTNNQNIHDSNTLIAAAYNNHSYQPSECGSACNDLALISTTGVRIGISDSSNGNGNIIGSINDAKNEDLSDDIMLDPELFLNPADLSTMSPGNKYDYRRQSISEYCDTIRTITWKNYVRLKRNVPLLLFQFVLPAIQVILFCICVGNDPFDIPVAVVNDETIETPADSITALSTRFLTSIDTRLVRQVEFDDLGSAIESVRAGKNWGVIFIPENFTTSVNKRFAGMEGEVDDIALENSTIKVYPDMTNQPIGHAMEVAFRRAYSDLSRQTFEFFGMNPALSDPPIRMESAIYGKIDMQNYLQYMSPGVLISISYIMATGLTSLAFIIERRDGLYDRTLAAGVDQVQMLISHSIVQLVVMVVQISLVVFFTFVIYKVPTNGPFVWIFLLLLLQGLAGMSFGLMVSSICREENTAIMMILGTFYPNLLLAGVIWPIEAIPYWLRWFSYLQPQTLPTQSLRDLIVRGWSIDQQGVWSGFAVTSIWLVVFLIISCVASKLKK